MSKIIILGGGRVGSAMAFDLAKDHSVKVIDIDQNALAKISLKSGIETQKADLNNTDFDTLLESADLVICAVPGYMGYKTLENIIEAKKNVVDISFFPEDPFTLNDLATEKAVTAVVDCGVAPGMGNIILGRYNADYTVNSYECLVGGLPVKREWPYEYKAVFSPIDVIEEYIRPARFIQQGQMITREALSDPELIDFEEVGTLESFNTDGLRSLMYTMKIPDMIEKTLRYPGTIEYLKVLRETGYFSYETVNIKGVEIRPIDLTSKLLFPKWELREGEEDFTVLRITMVIDENGVNKRITYTLFDKYDSQDKVTSMARTTGYTATAVANLILLKGYKKAGLVPPEYIGIDKNNFKFILNYLEDRSVIYKKVISQ